MGIFSSFANIIGGNKAADRYGNALSSGYQALQDGLTGTETRIKPTADIATGAIGRLNDVIVNGNMSNFYDSPDYAYNKEQSERGIQANAAAKGVLMSGNTLKALQKNASGLASQNYSSYLNNLNSLFSTTSPYLDQYNQIPYTAGQNTQNFQTALGRNYADAITAKYANMGGIGDAGVDAVLAAFGIPPTQSGSGGGSTFHAGANGSGNYSAAPIGSNSNAYGASSPTLFADTGGVPQKSWDATVSQNTGGFNWDNFWGSLGGGA